MRLTPDTNPPTAARRVSPTDPAPREELVGLLRLLDQLVRTEYRRLSPRGKTDAAGWLHRSADILRREAAAEEARGPLCACGHRAGEHLPVAERECLVATCPCARWRDPEAEAARARAEVA